MTSSRWTWLVTSVVLAAALGALAYSGTQRVVHTDILQLDNGATNYTTVTSNASAPNTTFTYPPNGGTANYVLRSDGAGGATWVNPTSTFTTGNLTESTSSILVITGGTGAVLGGGTTIAVTPAGPLASGYLSSVDWATFNSKQPAGSYLTALTSDVTAAGPGSAAATVNSVGGSTASAVHTAALAVAAATSAATPSTLAERDGSGNLAVAQLTAASIVGLSTPLPPTEGGTGLSSGTSGGVPYFSSSTTIGSSAALTAAGVVLGGGAGAAPSSTAAGTADQVFVVPHAGGSPAFGQVNLAQSAAVTGALPVANMAGPAATGTSGYLSSTDWTTFNAKQAALTLGNLTDAGTDGITVTGGTGAVVGSGTSLAQHVADTTHNGYLASTDWVTFNAKQPAGSYLTALTSDVSASGPGSAAATVNTVGGSSAANVHSAELAANAATATPTASTIAKWDANKNLSANALLNGYTTTATAAGTTTLTVSSTGQQYFTGSTTQTVLLPVVSTLVLGQSFTVVNNSSGTVTVQSSGANTVQAMGASSTAIFTVVSTSGTTAASWNVEYAAQSAGTVTSVALSVPASSLFSVSGSPVTTSGTLALATAGTSGGVPYFSSTSQLNTSALLTANGIVYGGGAGAAPAATAAGSATQVVHGGTPPTFSAVSLTADVTGVLPTGNMAGPAATGTSGYLSSTDWNTFNTKVGATRAINTTAPITGGGDLSADRTIAISAASTTAGSSSYESCSSNSSSWTGPFTKTCNIRYCRSGSTVTVWSDGSCDSQNGVTHCVSAVFTGPTLPAALQPAVTVTGIASTYDNGNIALGAISVSTGGVVTVGPSGPPATAFAATSGNLCGWNYFALSYNIN